MTLRILVTGAFGFVGRHVARASARHGHMVQGVGHGSWMRREFVEWGLSDWHSVDVTLENLITYGGDPDAIIHCAGGGSVAFSVAYPRQDFQRNVETTLAVLEYARLHRPSARVVLASSAAVYGSCGSSTERGTASIAPISPYGWHKHMAEQLCQSYAAQYGLSVSVVRLFSVYGSGLRKQLLWDACVKFAGEERPVFGGDGTERRDWLHVEDAASLLFAAIERASPAYVAVDGGTGSTVTNAEAIGHLAQCAGASAPARFSGKGRPGDPPVLRADVEGTRGWGWSPTVAWRDGFRDYVRWFRDEGRA